MEKQAQFWRPQFFIMDNTQFKKLSNIWTQREFLLEFKYVRKFNKFSKNNKKQEKQR